MHRILQVSFAALLVAVLSSYSFRQPAVAKPDGKTTTIEIGIGAALLGNLVKLAVDNGKAKQSGDDAMSLMNAPSPDTIRFSKPKTASTAAETPPPSARQLRVAILKAVADPKSTLSRDKFEILRTCWNNVILTPPTDAAADKNPAAAAPKLDCSSRDKDLDAAVAGTIDKYDASVAFSTAPSLYQQIIDLQVASHAAENAVRVQTIYTMGEVFLGYKPPSAASNPLSSFGLKDVFTSCVSPANLFDCVGKIGDAEASAAADRRTAVACGFARLAWLPTYSAIKMQTGTIDENTGFGAARGCR